MMWAEINLVVTLLGDLAVFSISDRCIFRIINKIISVKNLKTIIRIQMHRITNIFITVKGVYIHLIITVGTPFIYRAYNVIRRPLVFRTAR